MPNDTLKTPAEALDLMILSIDKPLLKPIEVIQLLDGLPDESKPKFQEAMATIGNGLRAMKAIRESLVGNNAVALLAEQKAKQMTDPNEQSDATAAQQEPIVSVRTYDWNGNADMPISYPHKTDQQVAADVRMLVRSDLYHELTCVVARDRIMALVKEKERLQAVLKAAEHLLRAAKPAVEGGPTDWRQTRDDWIRVLESSQ